LSNDKEKRRLHLPAPDYFQCKRSLGRLRRFLDLVRHHHRFYDVQLALPVEQLLPPGTPQPQQYDAVQREINKLIPLVHSDLSRIGLRPSFARQEIEFDVERMTNRQVERRFDVMVYFFALSDRSSAAWHDAVNRVIEQAISVYETYEGIGKRRMWNPFYWLARLTHFPISFLEWAGLANEETSAGLVKWYGRLAGALVLAVLVLLATKLGLSVPWEKLLDLFLKFFK
jgi:hypothetical protein